MSEEQVYKPGAVNVPGVGIVDTDECLFISARWLHWAMMTIPKEEQVQFLEYFFSEIRRAHNHNEQTQFNSIVGG